MNSVFLVPNGYEKTPLIFSRFHDAEESLLQKLRDVRLGGFSYVITERSIDYPHIDDKHKYGGNVLECGNLKILTVELPKNRGIIEEVIIRYYVQDDWHLFWNQLEDTRTNKTFSYRWIYFNDMKTLNNFRRQRYYGFTFSKVKRITDKKIKEHFKYMVWVEEKK